MRNVVFNIFLIFWQYNMEHCNACFQSYSITHNLWKCDLDQSLQWAKYYLVHFIYPTYFVKGRKTWKGTHLKVVLHPYSDKPCFTASIPQKLTLQLILVTAPKCDKFGLSAALTSLSIQLYSWSAHQCYIFRVNGLTTRGLGSSWLMHRMNL